MVLCETDDIQLDGEAKRELIDFDCRLYQAYSGLRDSLLILLSKHIFRECFDTTTGTTSLLVDILCLGKAFPDVTTDFGHYAL